jgi:hypothetical protein
MNVLTILFVFLLAAAALIGIAYVGSHATANVTDSYGNTMDVSGNSSQALAGNLTATGSRVGGGALLLIVGVFAAIILGGLVLVAVANPKKGMGR